MSFATYMVPYDYQQPKTNEQKSGIHIHQQILHHPKGRSATSGWVHPYTALQWIAMEIAHL